MKKYLFFIFMSSISLTAKSEITEFTNPNSVKYYFAYGSNMDSSRVHNRMEDGPKILLEKGLWHGPHSIERVDAIGSAILSNYELEFSKINSKNNTDGFATIVSSPGHNVEGVLYQLTDEHLRVLDYYEGFKGESNELNGYDRKHVLVQTPEGSAFDAIVYIANPNKIDRNRKPTKEYMEFILKGAREFALSPGYIQILENIPTSN